MAEQDDRLDRAEFGATRKAERKGGAFPLFRTSPYHHASAVLGEIRLRLGVVFEREMEDGRGFLWLPVAFGAGIVLYFALPREPAAFALILSTMALVVAAVRMRLSIVAFRILLVAALVATGVLAMKLRTDAVMVPRLAREMTATVTGWVSAKSEAARGGFRVHLRVASIEGLAPEATPRIVRVTIRSRASDIAVGDAISMKARLQPPSGPVMPGGYDFARAAFYEGIGAVGFAYGAARPATLGPAPLGVRLWRPIEELRDLIRVRVEEALPGDNGRIAASLIMGDQGGISEDTQDAMRASGLGHVLSISGLHMALVAGSAFWLIRALLALSQGLALTRPIKKWAAAGALAVAAFYLGISGGGVATDRSFVMLAIMLAAVLLDRRALTLRNVALAAFAVTILTPETVLSASFQMSFAATVALISAYEAIAARADRRLALADSVGFGLGRRVWNSARGLVLTSLIAGLATTPFAAYHFHRAAPLSLLSNLAAMPAVGILVMPMALAAVVLMPFGLEVLPLTVMDWGLDWMVLVAQRTSAWSEGVGGVRAAPVVALLLVAGGFLWLALWRQGWRLAGLVPIAAAVPLALATPLPDILVAGSGETVAVRGADGRLHIAGGKGASFEVENWLRADADPRQAKDTSLSDGVACDPWGCIINLADGAKVALMLKQDAFAEDCVVAAVVVSRFTAPPGCAAEAVVIDRKRLARYGAHALRQLPRDSSTDPPAKPAFRITTAYPAIHRPYMPAAPAAVSTGE
ncbi:MAG: ComEC/Rec2 family competence protein [Bauldia sp.]